MAFRQIRIILVTLRKEEADIIKLFKTLLVLIPCLLIAVLIIVAIPEKDFYILDVEGDLDAYEDPKLVNNSDIGFFYKNEQLYEYRKQKKPDKVNVIKMTENVVTATDFTKQDVSITPSADTNYTGPTNILMTGGQIKEFISENESHFILKGGASVPKADAFKIILDTGVWGSNPGVSHRIEQVSKYYASFTQKLQSMYFEFTSGNEFASIRLSGLAESVEYVLLDSDLKPLKNGVAAKGSTVDVQYKGRTSATYYLKVTGTYSENLKPFCVELPSDNNEWMWQMAYAQKDAVIEGKIDYYGDEDFFLLPPEITENPDKSVIAFTNTPADMNVTVYDKDKKVIAQYLKKADSTAPLSLYALKDAYAVSVYSFDGKASGESYGFVISHINTFVLDIQTYGFALSPKYSDEENYYTAQIATLEDKQITEVMMAVPNIPVKITVTQQCGYSYEAKQGENLKLAPGRNKVTVSFKMGELTRDVTIVISHRANEVFYSYTTGGKKVFIVDDKTEQGRVLIQKENGEYEWMKRSELYTYVKTDMPASYKEKIEALQAKYPNWKFTFVKTGYDFNSYVDYQNGYDDSGTPLATVNGKKAPREDIAYAVNPANFLDEKNIFMFEKQTYTDGIYALRGMESIWAEKEEAVLPESAYVSYFAEAGKSVGISPYFITARAALESGHGTSKLARGEITGYEGYYNFYGIDAVNSNPSKGGQRAKTENWNTRRRAIIEGAAWIKDGYIGNMQYSAYFMKFCFIKPVIWHQYMTDIKAPQKDALSYYTAHANGGSLSEAIEFVIPVFDNMP
jgi:beta-N-acetylglucosaminidase